MIGSAKQKKYVILLAIIVGFMVSIIFFLAPKTSITKDNSEISAQAITLQQHNPQMHNTTEENQQKNIEAEVVTSHAEDVEVLYDTKSDMTIQPVDPDTDPANKIDNIKEHS